MKSPTYIIGWINCPCCGANIECVKRRRGDMPLAGKIVYRPLECPACGEEYKISNAMNFYGKVYTDCPDGMLMAMGEKKI